MNIQFKKHTILYIFLILFGFSCEEDTIQPDLYGSIEGVVKQEDNGTVLSNVIITTSPSTTSIETDKNGYFKLSDIKTGRYSLRFEKKGYTTAFESFQINENQTNTVTIKLKVDTLANNAPNVPTNPIPIDGATSVSDTITLKWAASDRDTSDKLTYDVYLFEEGETAGKKVLSDGKNLFYKLENLAFDKLYRWQVTVKDGRGGTANSPLWSFKTQAFPDNRILFAREENGKYNVFSCNEKGGNIKKITNNGASNWRPRMSPLRNKIAFISNLSIEPQLYIMNRDGTNAQKVTTIPISGYNLKDLDFCWSPDGMKLLYMNNNKLYSINIDGTGMKLIATAPLGHTFTECDWTAQGNKIVARTTGVNGYNNLMFTMDADGANSVQVFGDIPGTMMGAQFSIDGKVILYTRDAAEFESNTGRQLNSIIEMKDLRTQGVINVSSKKISGTNDFDPRFSADGSKVIFVNTNNDGISEKSLFTVDLDGTNRQLLVSDAEMPEWK